MNDDLIERCKCGEWNYIPNGFCSTCQKLDGKKQ